MIKIAIDTGGAYTVDGFTIYLASFYLNRNAQQSQFGTLCLSLLFAAKRARLQLH